MKIKRYQQGGIYYTPFSQDLVAPAQAQATASTTKAKDKEDNLIEKEIMNVLKENGLPNDVDAFLDKANSFLAKSKTSLFDLGKSSYDMSDLIRLQSLANRIKHNNEEFKSASSQIISEGAGSDIALTNEGHVYTMDEEGDINKISITDYYKNRDKYQVLTNSELMNLRENHPDLAFEHSMLTDLKNAVGMKSIVNHVKSVIGSFGTNKSSSSMDSFTKKNQGKIEKGFEQLLGGEAPDGAYKVTTKSESSNQGYGDQDSLEAAVEYLYRGLPNNMKNVLRATATAEGFNPNNHKEVLNLLTMAVMEHTNHSVEKTISLSPTKEPGEGSGDGVKGAKDMTYLEMVANGKSVLTKNAVIASSKSKGAIEAQIQPYGYMLDKSNQQVGRGTLRDVLEKAQIGLIIDKNSVTFGNQRLKDGDLDKVIYDGTSTLNRTYLPIDNVTYANTGIIKPDLDATRRFEQFLNWYKEGYGTTQSAIESKKHDLNLDISYNKDTDTWYFNNSHPFLVVNGYASDTALNLDDNQDWMDHVDSSEGSEVFDVYKNLINYGQENPQKGHKRNDFSGGWFGNADSMYKSAIFMPITDVGIATVTTNHEMTSKENYINIEQRRQHAAEAAGVRTNFD